jgi:hypothetical protein
MLHPGCQRHYPSSSGPMHVLDVTTEGTAILVLVLLLLLLLLKVSV